MIHEWGHFAAARKNGVKVEEFGFGLPPRLWGKKKGETIYSLNWIPFGGFVRMLGEDGGHRNDPRSFGSAPIFGRMLIVSAGVIMNFLLAWVLITSLFVFGMKPLTVVPDSMATFDSYIVMKESQAKDLGIYVARDDLTMYPGVPVAEVLPDGTAASSGVLVDDIVKSIDDSEVSSASDIAGIVSRFPGEELSFSVWRDGELLTFPVSVSDSGLIGVALGTNGYFDLDAAPLAFGWKSPLVAFAELKSLSWGTVKMFVSVLHDIFFNFKVSDNVSGPVGIYTMTDKLVQSGSVMALIQLAAILSASLAVINIFPFPALDGGRLMFLVYELIFRRRPHERFEMYVNALGFLFLLGLLFFVTFKDVIRIM